MKKRRIAIYGAGGFGREVALMLQQMNKVTDEWEIIGFYDDGKKKGEFVDGFSVLGNLSDLNGMEEPTCVVIAIADSLIRKNVVTAISNKHISFPVLVHPNAQIGSESNYFGDGTIITAGCILTTGIVLGDFVIVNLSCTIGHDVKLGSFTSVMPGCSISGCVVLEEGCYVGTGVKIVPGISIGKNAKVGAGSVVTKSFESGTIVGIPARKIR